MSRGQTAVVIVVVGAIVGGVLGSVDDTPASSGPELEIAESQNVHHIEVHVAGWVVSPGVVQVAEGSIVADAVEAAGGFRPGAVADRINLAATVRSGDQVVVPGPEVEGQSTGGDGLIHLNRADAPALQALPGVGPVLAERIVAYRDQYGSFSEVEDLLQVPGIGEAKLASIRDLIRVP